MPVLPARTKEELLTVLGALLALHQPGQPDRIYPEKILCVEDGRQWPCPTRRLILGEWT